jgi:hypothetical protein
VHDVRSMIQKMDTANVTSVKLAVVTLCLRPEVDAHARNAAFEGSELPRAPTL